MPDFYKHALIDFEKITAPEPGSVTTGYNKPKCFSPEDMKTPIIAPITTEREHFQKRGAIHKTLFYAISRNMIGAGPGKF